MVNFVVIYGLIFVIIVVVVIVVFIGKLLLMFKLGKFSIWKVKYMFKVIKLYNKLSFKVLKKVKVDIYIFFCL